MIGSLCVVFDIDDTLYLETSYVASGFLAVDEHLRAQGITGFLGEANQAFRAGARGDVFNRALAALSIDDVARLVPEMVLVYREHAPAIELLADAAAALDRYSDRSHIAVVSDGPLASQRAKASSLGLMRWASPIVLTAAYGEGYDKPHPRGFEEVTAAHGASRYAYVADNPGKDFLAPARLGWTTVRVRRVGALHAAVPSGADIQHEVTNLDLLEDVLT